VSQTEEGYEVSLWDFIDGPDGHALIEDDEHDRGVIGSNTSNEHADHISFNTRRELEDHEDIYGPKKSQVKEPPPLASYPQLAAPKKDAQPAANTLWANASPEIRTAPSKPLHAPLSAKPKVQRKQDKAEAVPEEQFPALEKRNERTPAQGKHISIEKLIQKSSQTITGRELWAALPKNVNAARDANKFSQSHTKESAEEDGAGKSGSNKKKKKEGMAAIGFVV
jgi:hypothetical protein